MMVMMTILIDCGGSKDKILEEDKAAISTKAWHHFCLRHTCLKLNDVGPGMQNISRQLIFKFDQLCSKEAKRSYSDKGATDGG